MRIAHFAPFSPNSSGLYEAARDFVKADILTGHDAWFIDTGAYVNDVFQGYTKNPKDNRGGFELPITTCDKILDADIIVAHTGFPNNWLEKSKAPIIWILHGRPYECFKTEQNNSQKKVFTLISNLAKNSRVKKMVTMWEEHYPFWEVIIPKEKLVCLDPPPIDEQRFSTEGIKHIIPPELKGKIDILVADSWRIDVDIYEVMIGIIEASKHIEGIRIHNYAVETVKGTNNVLPPWNLIFEYTKKANIQGEIYGRVQNMEEVYRSMDLVVTPHRIVTRIVGEALCCGIPIIAGGSRYTQWNCNPSDPLSVMDAIDNFMISQKLYSEETKERIKETAQLFNLSDWGKRMNSLYEEVIKDSKS